jgi:hypothetical protein
LERTGVRIPWKNNILENRRGRSGIAGCRGTPCHPQTRAAQSVGTENGQDYRHSPRQDAAKNATKAHKKRLVTNPQHQIHQRHRKNFPQKHPTPPFFSEDEDFSTKNELAPPAAMNSECVHVSGMRLGKFRPRHEALEKSSAEIRRRIYRGLIDTQKTRHSVSNSALASCSPTKLASASRAKLILNYQLPLASQIAAKGILGLLELSQSMGFMPLRLSESSTDFRQMNS